MCYITEIYVGKEKTLPELDNLQQMALDVLSERSYKDEDILYFNSGNIEDMIAVGESIRIPRKKGRI